MADDMSNAELDAQERAELRRLDRKEAFFEVAYPAIIESIKTIVSHIAGESFAGPDGEDLYDALVYRLGEDLSEFSFVEAMIKAGAKPFDPWAVPTKAPRLK